MNNKNTVISNIGPDHEVITRARSNSSKFSGYYTRFGENIMDKQMTGVEGLYVDNMDFIAFMERIYHSKPAMWLFFKVVDGRDRVSNLAYIQNKSLTDSDKKKLQAGRKVLIKEKAIKRISVEHYLLNPYLVLPHSKDIENVRMKWNSL